MIFKSRSKICISVPGKGNNLKGEKALKGVGLQTATFLPRSSLLTIRKSFVRPHLDYGDAIYGQPSIESFSNDIETVKYNAGAITGTIKGASREKLYQELGLEYLQPRRWIRFCAYFTKSFQIKHHQAFIILFLQ